MAAAAATSPLAGEVQAMPFRSSRVPQSPKVVSLQCLQHPRGLAFRAVSGDGGGFESAPPNGLRVLVNPGLPLFKDNLTQSESGDDNVAEQPHIVNVGYRSGLFRTPISGGVQSATTANNLPSPALAVRNLMEQAQFGQLCTIMSTIHHHRRGYPLGSLVDFAPDPMGHPIFSLSPLAIHSRNLLADPRCSLVVQIPGWNSLSNARVTLFGDIFPVPSDQQEWARQHFTAKHQRWSSHRWGNFQYFRMNKISDIYFIGGFGTVAWVDVKEYEDLQPDKIAAEGVEQNLKELNALFSKPLKEVLSSEEEIDDAAFISIDSKGTDIRVRQGAQFNIQRISFEVDHDVRNLEEAKTALEKIIYGGCKSGS